MAQLGAVQLSSSYYLGLIFESAAAKFTELLLNLDYYLTFFEKEIDYYWVGPIRISSYTNIFLDPK